MFNFFRVGKLSRRSLETTIMMLAFMLSAPAEANAADVASHQIYSPTGLVANIDHESVKGARLVAKGIDWTPAIYLARAPSDHVAASIGKLEAFRVGITYTLGKDRVNASIEASGNVVVLPRQVILGVCQLSQLTGDQTVYKICGTVVKSSPADLMEYAWGKNFVEFRDRIGDTQAWSVKWLPGASVATGPKRSFGFEDPESLAKAGMDRHIGGYILLNFVKYFDEKESQRLFRELSEGLLSKEVVHKGGIPFTPVTPMGSVLARIALSLPRCSQRFSTC